MKSAKACVVLLILTSLPGWSAAGTLPLDPALFDSGLAKQRPAPFAGVTNKVPPKTRYFLPTGFTFAARLENAIFSFNVESPVIATVDREVEYLKKIVIPVGTKVIGTVSIQQDHDRVLINFHTLVFPETGDEIKFSGLALSLDGSAGIKGKVESHKDSAVGSTVLRSVITGTSGAISMVPGVSPIAAGATQGLTTEATKELDVQRQQVTTSISVDAETGLRVYLPQRVEY
jgi:type IV secretory pathway VirB10-like protein